MKHGCALWYNVENSTILLYQKTKLCQRMNRGNGMKDIKTSTVLLFVVLLFVTFCAGIFVGKQSGTDGYVIVTEKQDAVVSVQPTTEQKQTEICQETTEPSTTQASEETTQNSDPRIDINTASKDALMTLPGIGEKLAQRIIDFREANGPFQKVEELELVNGIGTKTIEKLRDLVKVGE